MRRFITYLYHCNSGAKEKGAGFIRVDQRGREVRLEAHVRDGGHFQGKAKLYLVVDRNSPMGIYVGEVSMLRGEGDEAFRFSTNNMLDSGRDFNSIIGVALRYETGYLVSNWIEDSCSELLKGTFPIFVAQQEKTDDIEAAEVQVEEKEIDEATEVKVEEKEIDEATEVKVEEKEIDEAAEVQVEQQKIIEMPQLQGKNKIIIKEMPIIEEKQAIKPIYRKLQLSQLRGLPQRNRHLCNNNFLIHSFYNYNYLILKQEQTADGEAWSLGVPGVYEQPEKAMAEMYGFTRFESQVEENDTMLRDGTFGAWFIDLIL